MEINYNANFGWLDHRESSSASGMLSRPGAKLNWPQDLTSGRHYFVFQASCECLISDHHFRQRQSHLLEARSDTNQRIRYPAIQIGITPAAGNRFGENRGKWQAGLEKCPSHAPTVIRWISRPAKRFAEQSVNLIPKSAPR